MRLLSTAAVIASASLAHAQPAPAPPPEQTPPAAPPVTTSTVVATEKKPKPWRVEKSLGVPQWLKLGLTNQSRFEHLSHDFRATGPDDVSAFLTRTLLTAVANPGLFVAGVEIADSRIYATDGTPMNTTLSNALEVLEAYAGARGKDVLAPGDALDVRAGRITIDVGTRRVVARNRYRNTINGFTGVDANWTSPSEHAARVFVVVPVTRLPSEAAALEDNEVELDEENTDSVLWAATYGSPELPHGMLAEGALIGFHESDGDADTRNRRLFTLQARLFRKPTKGELDFDVELIPQLGKARATTMETDTTDLDHRALSWHAEVGISPQMPYKPRIALLHDYASGDGDGMDDTLGRFDNLFGARRFDFGPTGTYGIVARQNLQTPGLRVQLGPHKMVKLATTYRLLWLADDQDSWTTAGVRDPTGDAGGFIGQQAEVQLQVDLVPKNLAIDTGAAYHWRGQFAKTAPNTRVANPAFFYFQVSAWI